MDEIREGIAEIFHKAITGEEKEECSTCLTLADRVLEIIPKSTSTLNAEEIREILSGREFQVWLDESDVEKIVSVLSGKIAKEGEEIHRFDKVIRRMLEECKLQNKQSATLTMENVGKFDNCNITIKVALPQPPEEKEETKEIENLSYKPDINHNFNNVIAKVNELIEAVNQLRGERKDKQ